MVDLRTSDYHLPLSLGDSGAYSDKCVCAKDLSSCHCGDVCVCVCVCVREREIPELCTTGEITSTTPSQAHITMQEPLQHPPLCNQILLEVLCKPNTITCMTGKTLNISN